MSDDKTYAMALLEGWIATEQRRLVTLHAAVHNAQEQIPEVEQRLASLREAFGVLQDAERAK